MCAYSMQQTCVGSDKLTFKYVPNQIAAIACRAYGQAACGFPLYPKNSWHQFGRSFVPAPRWRTLNTTSSTKNGNRTRLQHHAGTYTRSASRSTIAFSIPLLRALLCPSQKKTEAGQRRDKRPPKRTRRAKKYTPNDFHLTTTHGTSLHKQIYIHLCSKEGVALLSLSLSPAKQVSRFPPSSPPPPLSSIQLLRWSRWYGSTLPRK